MVSHIVRFSEFEYYNINEDEDWVRFTATTNKGSYFHECPWVSARVLRETREQFKAKVVVLLTEGADPQYVNIDEISTVH